MNLGGIISIVTAAVFALLGSIRLAVAQQEEEVLRLAREKVQVATSAGAFGHGVPILNTHIGSDLTSMALILSIAAIGLVGVISYYVLREDRSQETVAAINAVSG